MTSGALEPVPGLEPEPVRKGGQARPELMRGIPLALLLQYGPRLIASVRKERRQRMTAEFTGRKAIDRPVKRLETAVKRDLDRLTPRWAMVFTILGSVALTWPLFSWLSAPWVWGTAGTLKRVLSILPWAVLAGIIAAFLVLFVGGRLLSIAGSLFGGEAEKWQTFAAIGWSALALTPGLLLPLLLMGEVVLRAVVNDRPIYLIQPGLYDADWLFTAELLPFVPYILGFLLLVSALMLGVAFSRASKFSLWRGLFCVLLVPVAILLCFVAPFWLFYNYL